MCATFWTFWDDIPSTVRRPFSYAQAQPVCTVLQRRSAVQVELSAAVSIKPSHVHSVANTARRSVSDNSINVTAWRRETEWKSVTLVFVSESEYYNHDNNNNEYWNVVPRVVSTREDFSSCVWRVELVWAATCPEWLFFSCISATFLPFCYLNWVLWERRCYSLLLHHLWVSVLRPRHHTESVGFVCL